MGDATRRMRFASYIVHALLSTMPRKITLLFLLDLDIHVGLARREHYRVATAYPFSMLSLNFLTSYEDWPRTYRMLTDPESLAARMPMDFLHPVKLFPAEI